MKMKFKMPILVIIAAFSTCTLAKMATAAGAITVQIPPGKDNTLYESATGSLSNGAGWYFFVGRTNQLSNFRRRGIVAFNIADSVPAGATIQTVTLTLNASKVASLLSRAISLRKALADWGEGTSDAVGFSGNEGSGGTSTTGSVTWIHRFYPATFWTSAGGDCSGTTSGSVNVTGAGSYTFSSTPQMVVDVQNWLDNPETNFGWILLGIETTSATAKRFDSRENPTVSNRPFLTVTYLPPPCCVGNRGDINDDGSDNTVLDLNYMVNDIFRGGPPSPCPEEADLNVDATPSTILDLNFLINDIFRGGPSAPVCP